jgi:predicted nucleic acid-binding protein
LSGSKTELAQVVRVQDGDWHVPVLWRSELRSILGGHVRRRDLSLKQAVHVMQRIEAELQGNEHIVESDDVLRLLGTCSLSAYDCEFVALSRALGVRLVTEDKAILNAFPRETASLEAFASR